jgi:hypothetical protein
MPLFSIAADGSRVTAVRTPGLKPGQIRSPFFLPNGNDFLFLLEPADSGEPEVYLATLRGDEVVDAVLLLKNETAARYTPAGGGRLLYIRNDNLYSQRLNRSTRALEAEPELVLRSVGSLPGNAMNMGYFSVSRTGTIAWKPGVADLAQATVFDRRGERIATSGSASAITSLVLSPDETRLLLYSIRGGWVTEAGGSGRVPLPTGVRWFDWASDSDTVVGVRQALCAGVPEHPERAVPRVGRNACERSRLDPCAARTARAAAEPAGSVGGWHVRSGCSRCLRRSPSGRVNVGARTGDAVPG